MPKYDLKEDHTAIKAQIKEWELITDKVIIKLLHLQEKTVVDIDVLKECGAALEEMTNEMCTINM